MTLNQYAVFRCDGPLKKELVELAVKRGIRASAINSHDIGIVIMPKRKQSILTELLEKARKEFEQEFCAEKQAPEVKTQ